MTIYIPPPILSGMEEHVKALLYAISYLGITMPHDAIVIRDKWHTLYSSNFPSALFSIPYAGDKLGWEKAGHKPYQSPKTTEFYILHSPQQSLESDYEIATALSALKAGGTLMVVASNQTGGKSLSKKLSAFGCPVNDISKHKCRVVWTTSPEKADIDRINLALKVGGILKRRDDDIYTQPGIFSWDHQDSGTKTLLTHLPHTLSGKGADFGCGLGELSLFILKNFPDITSLTCIDHDVRAIECCKKNLEPFVEKAAFLCQDIPRQTHITNLDFIVMNPPFHIGKTEDKNLGLSFIDKAAAALKKGGILYMVANSHLPYEDSLASHFSRVTLLAKENGFKVFEAVR